MCLPNCVPRQRCFAAPRRHICALPLAAVSGKHAATAQRCISTKQPRKCDLRFYRAARVNETARRVAGANAKQQQQQQHQAALWRQGLHKAVANSSSRVVRFTSLVNICVNCFYRLCFAPNTVLRLIIVFNLYKKAVFSLPFRSSRPSPRTCSFCPSPLVKHL